ncbi:hypothetical protein CN918_29880 [Priestia megaterium]|nr:hypothetical protein CN918_29880 [Priestia megaterium]
MEEELEGLKIKAEQFIEEYHNNAAVLYKYKTIDSGSSRKVYDLKNGLVAKYASNFDDGYHQNLKEFKVYTEELEGAVLPTYEDLLAPSLAISDNGDLLIMVKCEGANEYLDSAIRNKLDQVYDLANKHDLLEGDLLKESSWGVLDDCFVLLDYGGTKEIALDQDLERSPYEDDEDDYFNGKIIIDTLDDELDDKYEEYDDNKNYKED